MCCYRSIKYSEISKYWEVAVTYCTRPNNIQHIFIRLWDAWYLRRLSISVHRCLIFHVRVGPECERNNLPIILSRGNNWGGAQQKWVLLPMNDFCATHKADLNSFWIEIAYSSVVLLTYLVSILILYFGMSNAFIKVSLDFLVFNLYQRSRTFIEIKIGIP